MSTSDKIRDTNQVRSVFGSIYKIVLAPGTYDLFHIGHLKYLQEAKRLGDLLIVAISDDSVVDKGVNRPVFPVKQRAAILAELECVDYVIINDKPDCSELIRQLKPNILVKGEELRYKTTPKLQAESQAMKEEGGEIIFLPTQMSSSSMLINDYLCNLPRETCEFLKQLKSEFTFDQIKQTIESLSDIDVTLIGETIIDEYVYGEVLGKSSKNPALVMNIEKKQIFAGGAVAVANHFAQLCRSVRLITYVGDGYGEDQIGFIMSKIAPNVKLSYFHKELSPTIKKTRYIDSYYKQRLFEIYDINQNPLNEADEKKVIDLLGEDGDLFIADFGHGLLCPNVISQLEKRYGRLYCNVQCNAGNYGYNYLSKYNEPFYASIDVNEFRLLRRDKYNSINDLVDASTEESWFPDYFSITEGKAGATFFCWKEAHKAPAMCNSAIDTVGSGDSYYAITSLLVKKGVDHRLIPFLGNISGAIAANIIGNEKAVSKEQILKNVEILLK